MLVVQLDCLGGRQIGLPILFRLFRPKDDARPELDRERPSQPELARTADRHDPQAFPDPDRELVCDGAYASKAWQGLPERVSVTSRMRANAAVYALPATERRPGQQGRTPLKGPKLQSLAQIATSAIFTPVTITGPDGRERTAHIHEFVCLWYKPFHTRPVKVILIRNPGRADGFDVALASTDIDTAAQLIARYDSRWTIETCPPRSQGPRRRRRPQPRRKAVRRTVPFAFLAQTITDHLVRRSRRPEADLHERRRHAPWYRQKTTISYTDMLTALRRELIRQEFWAQAPPMTTTPKLTQPQSPPALAAA